MKCGRDPAYFIKNYVMIRHPKRGLIKFGLFDYQENLLENYRKNRFNVVLKARQLGISEVTSAYATWLMIFHKEKNVLAIATQANVAKNIVKKVRTAIKNLPSWLASMIKIDIDNQMSLELDNGSTIKAIASSKSAGRSEALSLLIVDECAHIENMDELWTGLMPTVQAGGSVIALSTPNGVGNIFHKVFVEAESKQNDFIPTTLMWWVHPERIEGLRDDPDRPGFKTSPWFQKEIKSLKGPRDVAQELECNFNASGVTVLTGEQLKWIEDNSFDASIKIGEDRGLYIWFPAIPDQKYLISVDVARGDGRDFSTFHVWNPKDMSQMAEYQGKIPPQEFAALVAKTGRDYNQALVVVENNTIGLAVLEHLRILNYENLYYSKRSSETGEGVNTSFGIINDDLIAGFNTSSKSRPLMLNKLEEYVRNHTIVIRSRRLANEMKTFIWNNGRAEAMKGYNDDLVMSAALGVWIRDSYLAPTMMNSKINEAMLNSMSKSEVNNVQIGASKDPRFGRQSTLASKKNPYEIKLPNGAVIDIRHIIDMK